jgi:hypothetical protein
MLGFSVLSFGIIVILLTATPSDASKDKLRSGSIVTIIYYNTVV